MLVAEADLTGASGERVLISTLAEEPEQSPRQWL